MLELACRRVRRWHPPPVTAAASLSLRSAAAGRTAAV